MALPRNVKQRKRKTLHDEIADTEKRDQHEVIGVSISVTRGLFLHALLAMRDGDYGSVSAYVSDLIRRDKHIENSKPANLDAPPHEPTILPQSSPDERKLRCIGRPKSETANPNRGTTTPRSR
jgi:hypothetical protein